MHIPSERKVTESCAAAPLLSSMLRNGVSRAVPDFMSVLSVFGELDLKYKYRNDLNKFFWMK